MNVYRKDYSVVNDLTILSNVN
jgi:hypothetical protein